MTDGGGDPEADSPCPSLPRLAAARTRGLRQREFADLEPATCASASARASREWPFRSLLGQAVCAGDFARPCTRREGILAHSPGTDGARERQENQRRCLPAAAVASPGGAAFEAEAAGRADRQVGAPETPGARPENEHRGGLAGRRGEPLDALSLDPEGQLSTKARFGRLAQIGHRAVAGRKDSSRGDARGRFRPRDILRRAAP